MAVLERFGGTSPRRLTLAAAMVLEPIDEIFDVAALVTLTAAFGDGEAILDTDFLFILSLFETNLTSA